MAVAMSRRRTLSLPSILTALTIHLAIVAGEYFKPFNVTYDHRALIIDGKRRMLISAGIHYPRATPEVNIGSFTLLIAICSLCDS